MGSLVARSSTEAFHWLAAPLHRLVPEQQILAWANASSPAGTRLFVSQVSGFLYPPRLSCASACQRGFGDPFGV